MRTTYCEARMKFVDVTALEDSEVSSNCSTSFSDVNLLEKENSESKYGMLNLNQFVLDGSKSVLNPSEKIAWVSDVLSDENGDFATYPTIEVEFTGNHSSAGITLDFADGYPKEIYITWFKLNGDKITAQVFYPTETMYFCKKSVENYGKLKIEFRKTRLPFQFARLASISYGMHMLWSGSNIKSAKVLEEVNTISANVSINTADIEILDTENNFDIGNDEGSWKAVQKTQEVTLTEYIDGNPIPMGTFYLDDKSFSGNVASFKLIDSIGLMDNYTYYNGTMYDKVSAGSILEDIFRVSKTEKYHIADDVYNIELSGWLANQTCREALKMICFVTGAVADDARSDTINVYMPSRSSTATINTDRKFNGNTKIALDTYVSGVSIECNKYELNSEDSEIYNDVLERGTSTITFTEPYKADTITAEGCTIIDRHTNYVTVSTTTSNNVRIIGKKYNISTFNYQRNNTVEAGEADNVVKLGTCTLYNSARIPVIARNILSYYSLRKVVDLKYILETEHSGNWVNIVDMRKNQANTLIESQSIDLTGGFLATSKCRGYSTVVTEMYYTGNEELFTGDEGII